MGVSFQKAAKPSLTPWNGSVVLIFFSAKPQKIVSAATTALSACAGPLITVMGAFDERWKNLCCGLLKRDPHDSAIRLWFFQSAKLLPYFKVDPDEKLGDPALSDGDTSLDSPSKKIEHLVALDETSR